MPLTSKAKAALVDSINVALSDIGNKAPTKPPRSTDNTAKAAFEYWLSSHMLTMAKARHNAAKQAAIEAGIIFDSEQEQRPPGTSEQVYHGDQVAVWLTVKNGGISYDAKLMHKFLQDSGKVPAKLLGGALDASMKVGRPAHSFMASLITD
jgi:hypothetical protein